MRKQKKFADYLDDPATRLDLLKVEMNLIQSVFNKYDDMMFKSRNWFVTLWAAAVGLAFSARINYLFLLAAALSILYWVLESLIRHQHWYKYVIRYRAVRDALNSHPPDISKLSLYDLTQHLDPNRPAKWTLTRFRESFFRLEPFAVYFSLGVAALILWWGFHNGMFHMPSLPGLDS